MTEQLSRVALPLRRTDPTEVPTDYTVLRDERPVCPVSLATGDPAWLVTRNSDVKKILSDRRLSRPAACADGAPRSQWYPPSPDVILYMDPPRHSRIRKIASEALAAVPLERSRSRIQHIVHELLTGMAAMKPPVDLCATFARPLPLRIICDTLGAPAQDMASITEWTDTILSLDSSHAEIFHAAVAIRGYFVELLAAKRSDPGEDVISALIAESDRDCEGGLTESELVSLGITLLIAGHESSVTVIGSAALTLIRNPDQLAALREDARLLPGAVDELLRLGMPGVSPFLRITTDDLEIGDTVIPKGSAVTVNYETALRDPAAFTEPDRFDVRREHPPGSQVFFGYGRHYCLGSSLARAQLEIGLWELFDHFPSLTLAVPAEKLRWKDDATLGGFEELPVTW